MAKIKTEQRPKAKKNENKLPELKPYVYYIIIAAAAFIVYFNSLSNQFVFDDESVVIGDQTITQLSNIPKFFTGELGFHKVIGSYYRPIVSATYAIDYSMWKLDPYGYHLTNVLIHVINSLLFYMLLVLLFRKEQSIFKNYAILIAGLLFAVHPIHTEVVAWVSGRTDGISCTFFFAAFIYYLKYSGDMNRKYFILTLLMYLLALLSKEMAISLPVIIILYDMIVNRAEFRLMLKKRAPMYASLVALSFLFMLLRWWALKNVVPRETYMYFYGADLSTVIYTMLQTVPLYFRLSIVPYGMLYHYGGNLPFLNSLFDLRVIFALVFILVMISLALYFVKRSPYISYAILLFFITLIPVMNIVPTMNFMADRFLYIPSMFLSIITAFVIYRYYSKSTFKLIVLCSALVLVLFSYMTIQRNKDWKTNDILFMSAEGKPGTVTYVNIGNIYANRQGFDTAEVYYRKALDIKKDNLLANNNLGKIMMIKNNFDSAYYYVNKAYSLDTLSPEPMFTMAQVLQRKGDIQGSLSWLEKVQRISPGYMNAAQMIEELKKLPPQEMQQNTPNVPPQVLERIKVLEESSYKNYTAKNYDKAIEELKELILITPNNPAAYYNNMGMCYVDQGKYNEALNSFTAASKSDKTFVTAYNNIGLCYEKLNDKSKAIESYKKTLEMDPANVTALDKLKQLK
jgi:Tfp pilus assembly protein PilF